MSIPGGNLNGPAPTTRVFIARDYRLGISIRFNADFPQELNGRVDQAAYDYTINHINMIFQDAEKFNCNTFCESCFGFMTANLISLCRDTKYEKCLKRVSRFVSEQNSRVYLPRGLQITDPVERGLRCIEIIIMNDPSKS